MTLSPIPQDKITENQPWRSWFASLYVVVTTGATGTFLSSDVPAKTITVVNGIITGIK